MQRLSFLRQHVFCLAVLCLGAVPAWGQEKTLEERVNRAIDKGVEHLRKLQMPSGDWMWSAQFPHVGPTALVAWTLLESGVPADDPVIQKAAKLIRAGAVTEDQNYSISLALLFFDKLGDPRDAPLIESLAIRLLVGQSSTGGWTYYLGRGGSLANQHFWEADRQHLQKHLQNWSRLPRTTASEPRRLSPFAQQQLATLQTIGAELLSEGTGDNSNTQFAMLALWVARKHGIPVETAMNRVQARFQNSQSPAGMWTYVLTTPGAPEVDLGPSSPAMTCAGLQGLAFGHAVAPKPDRSRLLKDSQVKKGMHYLAKLMKSDQPLPEALQGRRYYFLWSLERTGMAYNLKKIEDLDWYRWGAEILLREQDGNGGWSGQYGICDTCFALLFLKRVNVTGDLTLPQLIARPAAARGEEKQKPVPPRLEPIPNLGGPFIEKKEPAGTKPKSKTADSKSEEKTTEPKKKEKAKPKIRLPFESGWRQPPEVPLFHEPQQLVLGQQPSRETALFHPDRLC